MSLTAKIFEIKRFAVHVGDGIRTTVFFKGCPLKCVWCHNPEGISMRPSLAYYTHKCIGCGECVNACLQNAHKMTESEHIFERESCIGCGACENVCLGEALSFYGKETSAEELLPKLIEDKEFYENSGGGVTLSGGECLLQADFCAALLKTLKENGVHTAVDTCGFVAREAFDKVIPYTDVFLYDIKAIDPAVHKRCTGVENGRILENLRYLDSLGCKTEIRIPYVPGWNDGEIGKIADFVKTLRNVTGVRVLKYHNYARSKYEALDMENTLPEAIPTDAEMAAAEALFGDLIRK